MPQERRSGHSMDEVPASNGNRNLPSLKARTLLPVPSSAPVSRVDLQRVPTTPNDHLRSFIPSSKQPDRQESRLHSIQNLLNPLEGKNRSNRSSAVGSPSLSELKTGLPVPLSSYIHTPYQVNQEVHFSQAQHRGHRHAINPKPPQPASQRDSPSTQYSSYSQFSQTESTIAPPTVSTDQPYPISSNSSSGPSSTMVQMLPNVKAFKVPTSSTVTQNQYELMLLETEQGPVWVPVNVHATSKDANVKRRKMATASHNFRQRRKKQEQETSDKLSKLEAQIRETEKEREYYRTERDYFRDLALRHRLPVEPRPPTPECQRHATMNGASLVPTQEVEGYGPNGMHTGQIPRVPSPGLLPAAVMRPLQIPMFQCTS